MVRYGCIRAAKRRCLRLGVRQRVALLPRASQEFLEVAAIVGRQASRDVLVAVAEQLGDWLLVLVLALWRSRSSCPTNRRPEDVSAFEPSTVPRVRPGLWWIRSLNDRLSAISFPPAQAAVASE